MSAVNLVPDSPHNLAPGDGQLRDHLHGGTWFSSEGQGKTVVLIHGVGLDHAMWAAQVAALKKRSRVITYDMLGHGLSAHPPGPRVLGDFVRQLRQLLLNLDQKQAAVVGFSMGGLVARAFAQRYPEMVSGLVLMNSVFRRSAAQKKSVMARYEAACVDGQNAGQNPGQNPGQNSGLDAALTRWFSPEFRAANPDAVAAVRDRLERNDKDGYLKAYRVFASATDPEGVAEEIHCPALIMTGELDSGSTPDMARSLARSLAGIANNVQLEILAGQRHMTPIEGAMAVNQLLADFLSDGTGPENRGAS